jgi:hypothetical protein
VTTEDLFTTYVDSNEVINDKVLYAVVASMTMAIVSVGGTSDRNNKEDYADAIIQNMNLMLTQLAVVPGPRAGGYLFPDESAFALTQKAGSETEK